MTMQPSKAAWTPALDGVLTTFVRTGADLDHIARVCGVSREIVEARLNDVDIASPSTEPAVLRDDEGKVIWTLPLDNRLRELAEDGLSAAEIGRVLGVTGKAVASRMSRIGARPTLTWNQVDRIVELSELGWRPSRIALHVGLSERLVRHHIAVEAAKPKREPVVRRKAKGIEWLPSHDARLRELVAAGMPIAEIACDMDRTPRTVHLRRMHLKLKYPAEIQAAAMFEKNVVSPTLDAIYRISKRTGVSLATMRSTNRSDAVHAARVEVYKLLRSQGWSLLEIGKLFRRDHTTIHHALKVESRRAA